MVYNAVIVCSLYETEPDEPSRYMDDILCVDTVNIVYDALFAAGKDYTLDSRGDVGAGYVYRALNVTIMLTFYWDKVLLVGWIDSS